MGCSQSTINAHLHRRNENSAIELLIAKRPGGQDVGPIRVTGHMDKRSRDLNSLRLANEREPIIEEDGVIKSKLPSDVITFDVVKVAADGNGVIFYHFCGTSTNDSTYSVRIVKRYSDFKALHAGISQLLVGGESRPALPEMPKANAWTYFCGRSDRIILKERMEQFVRILNALSKNPVAVKSQTFTKFLLA